MSQKKRISKTTGIVLLATALVLGSVGPAIADNDVGCGVGTMMMEGKEGLEYKIGASFTNQLLFQSISVTFGTLGCNGQDTVTAQVDRFTDANVDRIAANMAVGEGDALRALSDLMQIRIEHRDAFFSLTQDNFETLFPTDETTSRQMLDELNRLLAEDATLAVYLVARG